MSIQVDTDRLRDLANASNAAVSSLQQASSLLLQITQHQDWVCPNKTRINTLIESNRKQITRLHQNASSFNQAVLQVTEDFINAEAAIASTFTSLESLLSKTLSTETSSVGSISSVASSFVASGAVATATIEIEKGNGD